MCCVEAHGSIEVMFPTPQVLRVHREKLAPPMRGLGDTYAGKEFREWGAAANVTPQQWHEFRSQWVSAGRKVHRAAGCKRVFHSQPALQHLWWCNFPDVMLQQRSTRVAGGTAAVWCD